MVEILNFKKGATVTELNPALTDLNVWGILMPHCQRDKNMESIPLNWLRIRPNNYRQKRANTVRVDVKFACDNAVILCWRFKKVRK
jgi:hypothetical protein